MGKEVRIDEDLVTYGQLKGKRKYQKNSRIRQLAQAKMLRTSIPYECRSCQYSLHVEVSHKKDISSFPETTLISEINSLDNLEYLCKRCHWEYENGYLS